MPGSSSYVSAPFPRESAFRNWSELVRKNTGREGDDGARLTKQQGPSSSGKRSRAHDAGRERVYGGLLCRRGQGLLEIVGALRRSDGPRCGGVGEDAASVLSIVTPSYWS